MSSDSETRTLHSFLLSTKNEPLKGLKNWLQYFNGVGAKSLVAAYENGIQYQKEAIGRIYVTVREEPLYVQRNEILSRLKSYVNPDPFPQDGGKRRSKTTKHRRIRRSRRTLRRI